MEKKEWAVTGGVVFFMLLTISFAVAMVVGGSKIIQADMAFVSKTEYVVGDAGNVIIELRNSLNNSQVLPASCLASVWYPNRTIFVSNNSMTNATSGSKYINFTVPNAEGVFEYQVSCSYSGKTYVRSSSFHVSSGLRLLNQSLIQAMRGMIQVIPQGVSSARMSQTAMNTWLFNTEDFINMTTAACLVSRVVNNTKIAVTGQTLYSQNFASAGPTIRSMNGPDSTSANNPRSLPDATLPGWYYLYCGGATICVNIFNITSSPGPPYWMTQNWYQNQPWSGGAAVNFMVNSTTTARLPRAGASWSMEWDERFFGYRSDATFVDVMTNATNLTSALRYGVIGSNGLIGIGIGPWVGYNQSETSNSTTGTGTVYVRVVNTDPWGGKQWVRTNYTWAGDGTVHHVMLAKKGTTAYAYIDNQLILSWSEPSLADPVGMVFKGGAGSYSYQMAGTNYVWKVIGNDAYLFDTTSKLFSYSWYVDPVLFIRGQNYAVDCNIGIVQSDGTQQFRTISQYVYINNEDRIRAVTPK